MNSQTISDEVTRATDYLMGQIERGDIPPDALRAMIRDRLRMLAGDVLRSGAIQMQSLAEKVP